MTLIKEKIINRIAISTGLDTASSRKVFQITFEIIKASLANGDDLMISGFGKFQVRQKQPRKGRNPQTGEKMVISGRKVLTFKASKLLRKKINDASA
jgi:integration host factor subunit alpha